MASELVAPLRDDDAVIAFQTNNTYGEFMGDAERALNFGVVTQINFDPEPMTKAVVPVANMIKMRCLFRR